MTETVTKSTTTRPGAAQAHAVSKRDLRVFAGIVATGFGVVGALSWYRHRLEPTQTFARMCWTIGAVMLVAGLATPALLRPVHRFWVALGHVLGYINTRVILGLTYFGMFTSIGWLSRRVFGRDPLHLRKGGTTYWNRRERQPTDHRKLF